MSENDLRLKKEKAKKMMLLFALLSITMTFGGLTSAYVVSKGRPIKGTPRKRVPNAALLSSGQGHLQGHGNSACRARGAPLSARTKS